MELRESLAKLVAVICSGRLSCWSGIAVTAPEFDIISCKHIKFEFSFALMIFTEVTAPLDLKIYAEITVFRVFSQNAFRY